jgi:hypothetical protein
MSGSCGKSSIRNRRGERGEGRVKFLVTVAILAVVAYMGYQYVPVEFKAYQIKDYMQEVVNKAAAMGKDGEWLKAQLKEASARDYDVPDAVITTAQRDGRLEARMQYTRSIPLLFYTYQYNFDYTAKSTEFITK